MHPLIIVEMIADMLAKEMKSNEDVEELMLQSKFKQAFSCKNMVKYDQGEIRMFNLCNKLSKAGMFLLRSKIHNFYFFICIINFVTKFYCIISLLLYRSKQKRRAGEIMNL